MKQLTINIENKNTLQVIETQTGVTLIMLDASTSEPTKGKQYFYVVWNAKRGFFVWSNIWTGNSLDMSLMEKGNMFLDVATAEEYAELFNTHLEKRKP